MVRSTEPDDSSRTEGVGPAKLDSQRGAPWRTNGALLLVSWSREGWRSRRTAKTDLKSLCAVALAPRF